MWKQGDLAAQARIPILCLHAARALPSVRELHKLIIKWNHAPVLSLTPSVPATRCETSMSDENWDDNSEGEGGRNGQTGIATKTRTRTKKPSLYRVLILNDDYTPMEFVVYVLERFFNKTREEATTIMLHVHQHGVGVCGVFTYEVAETKVAQVLDLARRSEHPLQCTMEKE
jgi:ATP-dependent Clp protease adaptor protein ClpS